MKNIVVPGVGSTGGHMLMDRTGCRGGGTCHSTLEATIGGTSTTVSTGSSSVRTIMATTIGGVSRTTGGNVVRGGGTTEGGSTLMAHCGGTGTWFWRVWAPLDNIFSFGVLWGGGYLGVFLVWERFSFGF